MTVTLVASGRFVYIHQIGDTSAWKVLIVWRHIKNPTPLIVAHLFEEKSCQISYRSSLKRRSFSLLFRRDRPKENKNTKMSSDMGSVPDTKSSFAKVVSIYVIVTIWWLALWCVPFTVMAVATSETVLCFSLRSTDVVTVASPRHRLLYTTTTTSGMFPRLRRRWRWIRFHGNRWTWCEVKRASAPAGGGTATALHSTRPAPSWRPVAVVTVALSAEPRPRRPCWWWRC